MATVTKGAPVAPKPAKAASAGVLTVKTGVQYKGARAAWYAVLLAHNGKQAAAYLAACTTKAPSLPKSGRPEAPTGWLRYFVRNGVATIAAAQ